MPVKRLNISLPSDLVAEIDAAAKVDFISRSAFIREAISLQLRVDAYVEEEIASRSSSFDVIKAVHFSKALKRHNNRYKHLPYED